MTGLVATLLNAPSATPLFTRGRECITAGAVRDAASRVALAVGDAPILLHTASAAHFCAGLLAAAAENRAVALPAHAQGAYLAEIGADAPPLSDDAFCTTAATLRELEGAEADPLLIFFTSGSTGAPKRIEKRLSRLEREARVLDALWRGEAGHVVATVSHQHIYGMLFRIVWPVLSARTSDDEAALYWEDLASKLAGATLVSSPAHLSRLPPRRDLFDPPPALIFSSGQMLTATDARTCRATFGTAVTEVLGSTETGGIAWRRQTDSETPWTPLPGVEILVDEAGGLSVRTPHLQDGEPQSTGDCVELQDDGRFRLLPRGDRVVKIGGKRVSLARVEAALESLPEIRAAAGLTLPDRDDELAAIAVLSDEGADRAKREGAFRYSRALRAALASALEPAERPKHWRFVASIPTDAQGKRVLSRLRALFDPSPLKALGVEVRPTGESEVALAFTLPPDLVFFQGHFPTRAILPGVAQVHLAALVAEKAWRDWRPDGSVVRLKFRRVLMPGDAAVLKLRREPGASRVAFAFHYGEIVASSGEIGGVTP